MVAIAWLATVLTTSLGLVGARVDGTLKDLTRIRSLLEEHSGHYGDDAMCPPGGFNFGGRALTPEADVLPVPADELVQAIQVDPEVGYSVEEVKDGLWILSDGIYIIMFAETDDGIVLFDCPASLGPSIMPAISSVTDKKLTHIVYSHIHQDHIAGCGALGVGPDVEIIAAKYTEMKLKKLQDPNRPVPTVSFEGEYKTTIGGLEVELSETPDGHTDGDLFAYLPQYKTVNVVDVVYAGWVPFRSVALVSEFGGYVETIEELLKFDADLYVLGHLTRTGSREDVLEFQEYILDLQEAAAGAIANDQATLAEAIPKLAPNLWLVFNELQRTREDDCFKLLEPKWAGRLGGFDVFTRSHCTSVIDFLTID